MQKPEPELTDLLFLDDELYQNKFDCDYNYNLRHLHSSHSSAFERYAQEIRHFYSKGCFHFAEGPSTAGSEDYAKALLSVAGASCYNIRIHNMLYIFLATKIALNDQVRDVYFSKPCENGMQIMTIRYILRDTSTIATWYSHIEQLVHKWDFANSSPVYLNNSEKLLLDCVINHFFNSPLEELIRFVKADGVWYLPSELAMIPMREHRETYRYILGLDNN